MKLHGLYAITPDRVDSARIARAIEGGVAALQYRNKLAARAQRLREAQSLAALCRKANVLFIVNDDVEIAIASDADGVHLGRHDGDIGAARREMKGRILGISCYSSLEAAREAAAAGADYIAFGSVFPSPTKPGAPRAPLSLFSEARALGVPLVAIGGVTLENAPQLLAAGADAVAVISDLFDAPDVAARARAYARLFAHEVAQ